LALVAGLLGLFTVVFLAGIIVVIALFAFAVIEADALLAYGDTSIGCSYIC